MYSIKLLSNALEKNVFTDLDLTISDNEKEIEISVHKVILYSFCPYFGKLLSSNFSENNAQKIRIDVPNASVCYDIIMTFYGLNTNIGNLPKWKYILEMIKCRDFFSMEIDTNSLESLKLSKEEFGLFMDNLETFLKEIYLIEGYQANRLDKIIVNLIKDNMPDDYNIYDLLKNIPINSFKIVTCGGDRTIKIWDPLSGSLFKKLERKSEYINRDGRTKVTKNPGHDHQINCICVSPNGRKIISGSSDKTGRLWNLDMEWDNFGKIILSHKYGITGIAITSDNKKIISRSFEGCVKIWDLKNGELVKTLDDQCSMYVSIYHMCNICVTSDNKKLVYPNNNLSIAIYDFESENTIRTPIGDLVYCIAITPDNKTIVCGGTTIQFYDIMTVKLLNTWNDLDENINGILISSDQKKLVTCGSSKNIKIWDLVTGKLISKMVGHKHDVISICFSPCGKIISGCRDNDIIIWDMETGLLLKRIKNVDSWLLNISVVSDHDTSTKDKKIRLFFDAIMEKINKNN